MRRLLPFLLVFLLFAPDARAQECYTPVEAEAEQGLRIHSELMVIGLNCQSDGYGALMAGYGRFTQKHAGLIRDYEQRLIQYFSRRGFRNPEKQFHTLRTELANRTALQVVHMSSQSFCSSYARRMDLLAGMSDAEMRRWAATPYPAHPPTRPLCR